VTPYQRGNRDALLNLATMLDAEAMRPDAEYDSWQRVAEDATGKRATELRLLSGRCLGMAEAYRAAAHMARTVAEGMPVDPEGASD